MSQSNNENQAIQRVLPEVGNIVAVGAGKGGVGKSAVAVHVAVGLKRRGYDVGLLDCDIYGPSIATMTGIEGTHPRLNDERKILPFDSGGVKVISMANFIPKDTAVIWRGPMVHGAIKQFLSDVEWGRLDYMVIDLPPGTGDPPLTLAQTIGVTGAVIVATPQPLALNDAMRAAQMYQKLGIHILGIVENMSYFICPNCKTVHDIFGRGGVRKAAEKASIAVLAEIPLNLSLRSNTDSARVEDNFDKSKNPEIAAILEEMIDRLIEQVRIRNEKYPKPEPITVKKQ